MPANHNSGSIRLVRGSHIITKRLYDHDKAYIFQNSDGRILFAIPYLNDFTLIGTTDIDHDDTPDAPQISGDEIAYICREVSAYLKTPITPAHVLHTYSGVRPLYNDGAQDAKATTRDYVLSFEDGTNRSWSVKYLAWQADNLSPAWRCKLLIKSPHILPRHQMRHWHSHATGW